MLDFPLIDGVDCLELLRFVKSLNELMQKCLLQQPHFYLPYYAFTVYRRPGLKGYFDKMRERIEHEEATPEVKQNEILNDMFERYVAHVEKVVSVHAGFTV